MQGSQLSSRAFGDCLWPSLSLVGKKDKVCCQSWLLDFEWVLQRHLVRDCSHCLACTVGLFLQVRCSWARSPSPDCCRLLTGDDDLPPPLLLLILLVWQDVACGYTFDSKLGHKSHKEYPIWHHCHKEKHADNIVTNAGGVEPAESSTIAGSAEGYSTRGSCEDTGPLWHRHVFQSSFGSLAGRKKDEANVPVSTCSMPASSSSTRRPGARMDQNMYVSMTTRRARSTRGKKTFVCKIGPALSLATNKNRFGVRKSILPCGGFLVYL